MDHTTGHLISVATSHVGSAMELIMIDSYLLHSAQHNIIVKFRFVAKKILHEI